MPSLVEASGGGFREREPNTEETKAFLFFSNLQANGTHAADPARLVAFPSDERTDPLPLIRVPVL